MPGYAQDMLLIGGRLPASAAFLEKPFDIRALLAIVRETIG